MQPSRISRLTRQFESGTLDRRQFLAAAAAIGVSFTVAKQALAVGADRLDERRRAAFQQFEEGVVVVSNEEMPTFQRNFNPLAPVGASVRPTIFLSIYEGLLVWNGVKAHAEPALAKSWAFNEDNTELTFQLQEGVLWSDGEPFSAKDVIYTWDLFKGNEQLAGNGARTAMPYLDSWEAPDDLTVVFRFAEVFTPGLYNIGEQLIVPEHVWKDVADPVKHMNETPIGTGPMTEIELFEAQGYRLGLNPNYRYADRMKIKAARFPALSDNTGAGLAMTNGELDWCNTFIPDVQNAFVARDPEHFGYWFPPIGSSTVLWCNVERPGLDDVNVRKAISMGIDREQIVNIAMWDYTPPADVTGLSRAFEGEKDPAVLDDGWTTRNVDEANRLLDEAGYALKDGVRARPDGTPFKIGLTVVASFSDYVQASELIQQQLQDVGLDVELNPLEWANATAATQKGDFDLTILWTPSGPTVYQFYRATMSEETAHVEGGVNPENLSRFAAPEADGLLKEYSSTSDPDAQLRISAELQALFSANAPCLPLFYAPVWNVFNTTRIDGFASEDNPYTSPSPTGATGKTVLIHLHPVGEDAPDYTDVLAPPAQASPAASPMASPAT